MQRCRTERNYVVCKETKGLCGSGRLYSTVRKQAEVSGEVGVQCTEWCPEGNEEMV